MNNQKFFGSVIIVFFASILASSGSAAKIQKVHLKGNLPWQEKKMLQAIGLNNPLTSDNRLLKEKQQELLQLLARKGYLEVKIDSMKLRESPLNPQAKELFIWLSAGPLFSIKTLKIKSDSIPEADYLKLMESASGKPFDQDVLQRDIDDLLKFAADQGFPFARAEIVQIKPFRNDKRAEVEIVVKITEGNRIFVKDVVIQGLQYTRPEVVLRQLYFTSGMTFSQRWFNKIEPRLHRMQLFKMVQPPAIIRIAPDSVLILQNLKEGNPNTFDGVVGYVPPPANSKKNNGYFTGLIDLSFRNLFGTGRKFKIYWEKSDRLSENFNTQYQEPWIFNLPLDAGLSFSRQVRDTLYIAYDFQLASQFHFNESLSLFLNFSRQSVNPDSLASWEQGLIKNRIYGLEIGLTYDTRDYPLNPRSGLFYQSSYSYGLKQNLGPAALIYRDSLKKNIGLNSLQMQFEWYKSLFKNQVLATKFNLKNKRGTYLQLSDYFWFGGSQSVRGYHERQFSGYLVAWLNMEYRFIVGRNARVFLFTDWGYYKTKIQNEEQQKALRGIGLGLRFETPMGIMGVDYGVARGESFRQGKIHVRLTSQF